MRPNRHTWQNQCNRFRHSTARKLPNRGPGSNQFHIKPHAGCAAAKIAPEGFPRRVHQGRRARCTPGGRHGGQATDKKARFHHRRHRRQCQLAAWRRRRHSRLGAAIATAHAPYPPPSQNRSRAGTCAGHAQQQLVHRQTHRARGLDQPGRCCFEVQALNGRILVNPGAHRF